VYFVLIRGRDRSYWLPQNRIKELILKSELLYSPHATCVMNCRKINKEEVLQIVKNGEVNFDESNIHNTPCPSYAIDGLLAGGKRIRIIVTTVDSVAEVETAIDLNLKKDSCICR
jgi:hypothetical protein